MKLSRLALFDGSQIQAADATERSVPEALLLLKFGENCFTKGGDRGHFDFTISDADNVIADFSTRGKDLVIDYEHQTLSGAKAPAAGWIASLEKSAEGLVAKVRYWTDEARGLLLNGEYRYLSPVLLFSRSGRSVSAIHSVALTNHPALHEAPALVADDAAAAGSENGRAASNTTTTMKGVQMDELLEKLGLVALADANDEERHNAALAGVDALLSAKASAENFLKLHDCKSFDDVEELFQSMCPASEKERLEKALNLREAEMAVAKAFSDGKLAEASRAWALAFAERDLAAFNDWANAAPRIVPDNEVDVAPGRQNGAQSPDPAEVKVYKTLGLSDEMIEKLMKGE